MTYVAVVVAAGQSQRCGGGRKHLLTLADRPIIWHALQPFIHSHLVDSIFVITATDDDETAIIIRDYSPKINVLAKGGSTRAESVLSGIDHCHDDDWVIIHDAARPLLLLETLQRLLQDPHHDTGVALAWPVTDAIKKVSNNRIVGVINREGYWQMQTPQLFQALILKTALKKYPTVADDSESVFYLGLNPLIIKGQIDNIKITYKEDLNLAQRIIESRQR